jgi:hypothetical protein
MIHAVECCGIAVDLRNRRNVNHLLHMADSLLGTQIPV